jgi:hypothetical protein
MIVQVPKMAAAALADATYGVNAQLAVLAGLGYFGADPTPPDVTVTEPSSDDFAALMNASPEASTGPVVAAMFNRMENFPPFGIVAHRDAKPIILIRYDNASLDDASALYRDCGHTMRAILMALAQWLKSEDDSRRKLEGVHVMAPGDMWIGAPPELSQDANPVTFAVYCQLEVEDIAP